MHTAVRRVIFYFVLAATCYGFDIFFGDSQAAFVAVFSLGIVIALFAELVFWRHIYQLFSNRRTR